MTADWVDEHEAMTLDEALDRRRVLTNEIVSIEHQLGDRARRHTVTRDEYNAWRTKAKWSLWQRSQEKRLINHLISQGVLDGGD